MKFMIFVIICFYSLSNHITNGKDLCSGNSIAKIIDDHVGYRWAIGYRGFMYWIFIHDRNENCTLTIKNGNENDTLVINKYVRWYKIERKYFIVYSYFTRSFLEFLIKTKKPLDESYDNLSIYLNCRREKCQLENIAVKNCSENGNHPNDQFKITYDKRSYEGNGNASCISGMLYNSGHLSENQFISVTCSSNAKWYGSDLKNGMKAHRAIMEERYDSWYRAQHLESYECWKDSENVTVEGNWVMAVNETLNLTCDFIEGFPHITIIEFILKHNDSSTFSIKSAENKVSINSLILNEREYKYVRCEISYNYKNQSKKFSSDWKPLNIQYINTDVSNHLNNDSNKEFNSYTSPMDIISDVFTGIKLLIGT